MATPQRAVLARLTADVNAMSYQLARVSYDLAQLDQMLAPQPPPMPVAPPAPASAPWSPPPVRGWQRSDGWIGKALAVAGVAVTLIGVALLLVLAAQAGLLRPEVRVGAGAALAAGLMAVAGRLQRRPGGRVGAIALAATGIAAAYIDIVAVTTVYHWLPAAAGLVIAAVVGGGGVVLARRWDSEQLGLLVLVPLVVLAPIVTDGITVTLIGFLLALAAAVLPVQLGKDWVWLHAASTAASTLPLLLGLVDASFDTRADLWLAGASGIAAVLATVSALLLLPSTTNRAGMAVVTAAGALPVLCVSAAVDPVIAALMAAALSAAMLAVVAIGDRLPGVTAVVRRAWSALSATAALIAVLVAFDGAVAGPVLLSIAAIVAVAGRRHLVARWIAGSFAAVGGGFYLDTCPPDTLMRATTPSTLIAVSTLITSLLVVGCAVLTMWAWTGGGNLDDDVARILAVGAAAVAVYALTAFTVTTGVLIGGPDGGFFAGHVAATICWVALAAVLFGYATRRPRAARSLPIAGGLALVAAAMAKVFLFDLGTLDGIFRVVVFIVVGLALLGMGAGYARRLAAQDQHQV